jgi:trimeric autotransporter adhesin
MRLSWTSGNGARRIVVVRQGTVTTWTPMDGTPPPSGVSSATCLAPRTKAAGTRSATTARAAAVTLTGLNTGMTYTVTMYEYNGTGTSVNYLTAGNPLTGHQTTQ